MEVKSMKGIKFKDAVIPVKELKEWIKMQEAGIKEIMRSAMREFQDGCSSNLFYSAGHYASDLTYACGWLRALKELKEWVEKHERKD